MTPLGFREVFSIIHNLDQSDLVDAGVIGAVDHSDWVRFNNDIGTFVLKLPTDRLSKLVDLIQSRASAKLEAA